MNRNARFFLISLFWILSILLIPGLSVYSDTWNAYQHDLQHTGFTSEAPELPLEIKWHATLCPWMNGGLSPIVSDGTYSVVGAFRDYDTLFPQSTENLKVWCVRNNDGSIAWQFETGGIVVGSPQIAGDKVYVVSWDSRESEDDPYASSLWALRLSNGSVAWEKHFEERWASPPAVKDDILVVPVMYKPFLQNADGVLYAYNATSGFPLWNYPALDRMISDDWFPNRPNPPCIYDNRVYFQDTRNVYAVNLTDGSDAWTTNSAQGLEFWELGRALVAADGKLFFVDTNVHVEGDARIVCLRADNGKGLWQWLKQGEEWSSSRISGVSYANGIVYASLSWTQVNDAIVAIDGITGGMIRRSPTGGSVARTPIITGEGNVIYLCYRSWILNPQMDQILFDFTDDHGMLLYGDYGEPALANSLVITGLHPYDLDNFYLTAFGHDTTPPVADITKPQGTLTNPGKIDISGFATDFNFDYWELSYARLEDTNNWTILTSDTQRKNYEG
ncbi:PQQ-like beta-propeller repeat protein, partial [Candidatus Sumerlaeota bacterium]|nr:PQQ-like beta-propeller repeat protein [Candidatus Sumerlaeota bacterium]